MKYVAPSDIGPERRSREHYSNPRAPAWVGLGVIVAFLCVMGLWGTLAPVSGAAIAQGQLKVQGNRKAVQHPYGGVVRELLVKEGDRVEQGQVLLRLVDNEPRARVSVLDSEQSALLAQQARLIAERDKADEPDFGKMRSDGDDSAAQAKASQRALMEARRRQFETETEVIRQKIAQIQGQIAGSQAQFDGLLKQIELASEEIAGARTLLVQGYTPKTRVIALERDMAKLEGDRGARSSDIARGREAIAESNLEVVRLERTRLSEITDQLRTTQTQLAENVAKLDAARDVLQRTAVAAPAAGAVVNLAVFTEGGVVKPGDQLLEVVPLDLPLIVDARLAIRDISEIANKREADVRLTSINRMERPNLAGEIINISADRISAPSNGSQASEPFYSIQVRLNEADVRKSRIDLQPGMAAEVIVTTQPRTLFQYLIGPLSDEITGAFREK